jgi:hypothetical protein
MKSSTHIISLNHPNQFDRTALGLIFYGQGNFFIDYSKKKLRRVSKEHPISSLLRLALRSLKANVNNSDQVKDLSRNLHGVLQITTESSIILECNKKNFKRLFEKYVNG